MGKIEISYIPTRPISGEEREEGLKSPSVDLPSTLMPPMSRLHGIGGAWKGLA